MAAGTCFRAALRRPVARLPEPLRPRATEMDGSRCEFLDADRRWILCSMHGARTNRQRPLRRRPLRPRRLTPLAVAEHGGQVYWYPSRDIRPLSFDAAASGSQP